MVRPIPVLALTAALTWTVTAHPGHDVEEEIAERSAFLQGARRDLSHCAAKLKERGVDERALQRRSAAVKTLRRDVALEKRQMHKAKRQMPTGAVSGGPPSASGIGNGTSTDGSSGLSEYGSSIANTSHLSNLTVSPSMQHVEEIIFAGNRSCVLNPEGEVGPYYVRGELVRKNIREGQAGVPITIDGQFIDVATCEPIKKLYWDVWHCNATGVYAGVVASGNGNQDDVSNLNNTALRGIQATDCDGVATFDSLFPGHYSGRTTHIHVVAHVGAHQLPNGTIAGGNITHTGQFFFDQGVTDQINSLSPYNEVTAAVVTNAEDRVFSDETAREGSDPVFNYVLLGDSVEDGLFAWITVGVDLTANYTASPASRYYATGGVSESSGDGGLPG